MPVFSTHRRLYVSNGWSGEGRRLRRRAINDKLCARCGEPLTGRQVYYCSPRCSLYFWKRHWMAKDWQRVRKAVLERDSHRCVRCGSSADEVDHIVELAAGGDEFDMDNCQSLCAPCHKEKTASFLSERLSLPQ